jgi:hypothetical protein
MVHPTIGMGWMLEVLMFRKITYKLQIVFAIAVVFAMQGCSLFDDGRVVTGEYYTILGGSLASDTTALLAVHHYETYEDRGMNTYAGKQSLGYELYLIDITKNKIYKKQKTSLSAAFHINGTGIEASSVLLWLMNAKDGFFALDSIWLWNINRKQPSFMALKWEGALFEFSNNRNVVAKEWMDDQILLIHDDANIKSYALIDTTAKAATRWYPSQDMDWLDNCLDIQLVSDEILCIQNLPDTSGFALFKNGTDILALRYVETNRENGFRGFNGNYIVYDGWIYPIIHDNVSSQPLNTRFLSTNKFIDSNGNENCYFSSCE